MNKARAELGNSLFKLAKIIYSKGKNGNPFLKKLGNEFFKLAANVYPDKENTAKAKRAIK